MRIAESIEDMNINIRSIKTLPDVKRIFSYYQSYKDLVTSIAFSGLDLVNVVQYVVLLYSEDSILNTRPPQPIDERMMRAAKLAKLLNLKAFHEEDRIPSRVKSFLFELKDPGTFQFIFEYLTREKKFLWQDIVTIEHQLLENLRFRLSPVLETDEKKKAAIHVDKHKMTDMGNELRNKLNELYEEFYGDNEKIRTIHRLNREKMATIENYAI